MPLQTTEGGITQSKKRKTTGEVAYSNTGNVSNRHRNLKNDEIIIIHVSQNTTRMPHSHSISYTF